MKFLNGIKTEQNLGHTTKRGWNLYEKFPTEFWDLVRKSLENHLVEKIQEE
jgi:hypothetical protein